MSAHTPGPWKALGLLVPFGYVIKYDEKNGDESIAYIQAYDIENEEPEPYGKWSAEAKANHDLVLAAPELLDAAKLVLAWYEAENDFTKEPDFYKRVEMCRVSEVALRAAIAKATGDQT